MYNKIFFSCLSNFLFINLFGRTSIHFFVCLNAFLYVRLFPYLSLTSDSFFYIKQRKDSRELDPDAGENTAFFPAGATGTHHLCQIKPYEIRGVYKEFIERSEGDPPPFRMASYYVSSLHLCVSKK